MLIVEDLDVSCGKPATYSLSVATDPPLRVIPAGGIAQTSLVPAYGSAYKR